MPKWYYGEVHEVEHEGGNPPGFGGGRPARPGRPDQGLPPTGGHPGNRPPQGGRPSHPWAPPGGETDPGYGHGSESPDQGLPELPPEIGIWPPPSPAHPVVPVPPDHALPPGAIWPPLPDHAQGKFLVLAWVSGEHDHSGWHYVVIDTSAKPDHSLPGRPSQRPPQGGQPPARPGQPGAPAHQPGAPPASPDQGAPPAAGHQPAPPAQPAPAPQGRRG